MPFLLPAAATAVAAAAPAAAAAAATTAAATAGITATLTSVATNILMNVAISAVMSALSPQVGAAGRTFEWTLDPDGPIPFAAGRIGVAGSAVYRETFGPDLMYYGIPSVISGAGPIDGFESFLADDESVTFDGTGKAISSQYAGELWYKTSLGAQPATAITSPSGLKSGAALPGWTSAHKLSGKASYMIIMGENSKGTAFPTGEIKPLVTVRGLKGWDPRKDSTYPGGSGACRLNDPSTWVYLANPILWALKWSLGLWEGPTGKGAPQVDYQVGGIGAKLSGIDVPAFVAAANVADANGWTVAAYPTTDDDKAQVLDAFLQAGGATYAQRAGKISCIQRAAPRTSIVTISGRDTAGPLEIDTAASRIDRINTIRPRYWSEAHRWQLTALPEVTASAYQTQDGGKRTRGIDYPYVTNPVQAAQLAALQIANTREGIAGVIPLKPHLQRIRPGDAFTITEEDFVLNGVKCLCLNTDYDPATGIVRVSFVSETDAKYPFALGQSPDVPVPPVLTPVDTRYVGGPLPGDWTVTPRPPATGGTQLPGFDLTGLVSNSTATAMLVEYGPDPAGPWKQAYQGPPTVTNVPIDGVQPGAIYYIAVSYQRGQNFSQREVYGPYTAPGLVAGDVLATSPTITGIQGAIDAVEGGVGAIDTAVASLNAAIYTAGTGLKARSDAMFASLNTPETGVVARLTATETRVTSNNEAAVNRLGALEASVNTPTTGIYARLGTAETAIASNNTAAASRLNALEATVSTAGTGLSARMGTSESAITSLATNKADASRVTTLEGQVNTASTGILARLTTVEAAEASSTSAAISRLSALEATINTSGTGLSARVGTAETAIVSLGASKADASRVVALEAQAGGDALNVNSTFNNYPNATGLPPGLAPSDTPAASYVRVAGRAGAYGIAVFTTAGVNFQGFRWTWQAPNWRSFFPERAGPDYWVIDYKIEVGSGGLDGVGFSLDLVAGDGSSAAGGEYAVGLKSLVGGNVADDVIVEGSHLFRLDQTLSRCRGNLWFWSARDNFPTFNGVAPGGIASAKRPHVHRLSLRAAREDEMASGVALPLVTSRVGTLETTTASLATGKADASRVTSLEATINTAGTGISARMTTVESVAASANGTAKAIKGVVTDVNGRIGGYASSNDGTTTSFEILASVFGIRDTGSGLRTEYRAGIWYVYDPDASTRTMYGKAFGGANKLTWWTGPSSVAEGSETKVNAYVFISTVAPRFGGTDTPGGGVFTASAPGVRVKTQIGGTGAITTPSVPITVAGNTGTVTYSWSVVFGDIDGITISSSTSANPTFSASPAGVARLQAIWAWTATDSGTGITRGGQTYVTIQRDA